MKIMKIQFLFTVLFMVLMLASCGTEFETENAYASDVEISTRDLNCIQDCNDKLFDCRDGNGQIGEGHEDYYAYLLCRCPDGAITTQQDDDCVWMGNNQNNPDALNCEELYQLWADYQDECYIGYTVCVGKCKSDNIEGPKLPKPKGDCDGDGILNYIDNSPGC